MDSTSVAERLDVQLLNDHGDRVQRLAAIPTADGPQDLVWRVAQYRQPVRAVLYLTDRMVFTDGAPANILRLAERHPARVISYNHDRIDDSRPAVTLEQRDWSGKLFEMPSEQLLRLTAQASIPPCLLRLLNSVVPLEVLGTVRRRFGTVFCSLLPTMPSPTAFWRYSIPSCITTGLR